MKIKFIYPKFQKFLEAYPDLAEFPDIAATWSYTMPPAMGIPVLIKTIENDPSIEWHIQDQNIEDINFDDGTDVVVISFFTPQAAKAYELGDTFLSLGKTVLMGGMHPSMIPDDVEPHCSAVCVGEGDVLFPQIIKDIKAGTLKKRYDASPLPTPEQIVIPKKDVFNIEERYDWHASLISVTRGCPFGCEWCNIPHYQGKETRLRPMDDVVEDIRQLAGKEFYITDDMIMLNRPNITEYFMELCDRIKEFDVKMFLSCSPAMNRDPKFLDKIAEAGASSMYTVFASDPMSKRFYKRHPLVWQQTIDLVKMLEDRGIRFFGSFGVGFDCCREDQFDLILEFCDEANVKTAEFFIATPFPNTKFWHRLKKEGRLHEPIDWKNYNCANVVFKPKHTTEEELVEGYLRLWKEFFSTRDYEISNDAFNMDVYNILKSREYSKEIKEAVQRGIDKRLAEQKAKGLS